MTVVSELTSQFGVAAACQALAVPRSSFYRSRQVPSPKANPPSPPARSPRALSEEEQSVVRETLNSPRFVDQAPREVYATLLEEERYLCSWRTMYRILEQNQEVRERRDQHLCVKDYFQTLQRDYPGQFNQGQLRPLQRRVKEWRAKRATPYEMIIHPTINSGEEFQARSQEPSYQSPAAGGQMGNHGEAS